jgi:hypothetical protein
VFAADHFHKRQPGINTGRDDVCANFVSVFQGDASGLSVFNNDFGNGDFRSDLGSGFARGVRNCIRDGACSAAHEAPRAKGAVDLAHVMVQQNVRSSRRTHAKKRADNS